MLEFIFMNLPGHNFLYKEKGDPEIFHGGGTILLVPIFWSATLSHIWGGGAAARVGRQKKFVQTFLMDLASFLI